MKEKSANETPAKKNKTNFGNVVAFISSVLFIVFGVLMIAIPSTFVLILFYSIGAVLALAGVFSIVRFFTAKEKTITEFMFIFYGAVSVAMAVICFMRVDFLLQILTVFAGIFILVTSVVRLFRALSFRKLSGSNVIAQIIFSSLGIVCGALCIIGKIILPNIVMVFIGVVLIVYGVFCIADVIVSAVQNSIFKKNGRKERKNPDIIVEEDFEDKTEDEGSAE